MHANHLLHFYNHIVKTVLKLLQSLRFSIPLPTNHWQETQIQAKISWPTVQLKGARFCKGVHQAWDTDRTIISHNLAILWCCDVLLDTRLSMIEQPFILCPVT